MCRPQKRLFVYLVVISILLFTFCFLVLFNLDKNKNLKVNFLDVGQGDAIMIKTKNNKNILIDGGPDETILKRLGETLGWLDRKINLMILTHPHADHVTGLIEVVKRYDVDTILYTGVTHTSPNFLEWLDAIKRSQADLKIIKNYQKIFLDKNTYLEILYPTDDLTNIQIDNLNNSSIVCRLVVGDKKFLFMGDAEAEVEEMLNKTYDMKSDVIKIGHHGSGTSDPVFLHSVLPKISIVSVGADNGYGHPDPKIISELNLLGSKIYRTDQDETIVFTINNGNIQKQ